MSERMSKMRDAVSVTAMSLHQAESYVEDMERAGVSVSDIPTGSVEEISAHWQIAGMINSGQFTIDRSIQGMRKFIDECGSYRNTICHIRKIHRILRGK